MIKDHVSENGEWGMICVQEKDPMGRDGWRVLFDDPGFADHLPSPSKSMFKMVSPGFVVPNP